MVGDISVRVSGDGASYEVSEEDGDTSTLRGRGTILLGCKRFNCAD